MQGQNVAIEYRWAEGRFDRLPALAADLVRRQVAVIAALEATTRISPPRRRPTLSPSFSVAAAIPSGVGLVASLSRPTGNIPGYSFFAADIVAKQFGLLRDLVPDAEGRRPDHQRR